MAPRAYWKGSLKLSLVTCPIALFRASTQAERTHFHQINTQSGHRLRQQMVDDQTGRVVDPEHKGRGYELSKGKYVAIAGKRHPLSTSAPPSRDSNRDPVALLSVTDE